MQRDALLAKLGHALVPLGLDLGRYTTTLLDSFLERFPDPDSWPSGPAQRALISTFAIGETTFLRDREQFRLLTELLPELTARAPHRPLRVLCLGCASGEEAYSLVASLRFAGATNFEVTAWDINPEFIARARRGEYRPWSLRGVTDADTSGWLKPSPSGVKVEPWLTSFVRFEVRNLCSDPLPAEVDVIFCRNVLLYFRRDQAQPLFERCARALCEHGVLFLGHHDPRPLAGTGFHETTRKGVTHFARVPPRTTTAEPLSSSFSLVAPARLGPAGLRTVDNHQTPLAMLEAARLLSRQERFEEARELLKLLLEKAPLLVDAHVLSAVVEEERGDVRQMLEAARRACFLAPDAPGPNYYMSVSFLRAGEIRRAALHRRIAVHALTAQRTAGEIVEHSEGLTVSQLRRLVGAVAR